MADIDALQGRLLFLRAEGARLRDQLEDAEASANENNIRIAEARIAENRAERDQVLAQINNLLNGGRTDGIPYTSTPDDDADIVIRFTDLDDLPPGQTGGTGLTEIDEPVPQRPGQVVTFLEEEDAPLPGNGPAPVDDFVLGDPSGDFAEGGGLVERPGQVVTFLEEEDDPLPRPQLEPNLDELGFEPEIDPDLDELGFEPEIDLETPILDAARDQAAIRERLNTNPEDWRVKLRLAPSATYLYKDPSIRSPADSILWPLRAEDGVIFPYTPRIDITYRSEYTPYDPTHANHRYYFYKGSRIESVLISADFTAQDTREANYLLAVIHFFRSASKMFYGQDADRGAPPPLVYMSGLGQYQFANNPCVITQFNYMLPDDVDYIRADTAQIRGSLQERRALARTSAPSYSLSNIWARLNGSGLNPGATNTFQIGGPSLTQGQNPTYVPTKITITLELLPIQSRKQVSSEFSLREYANGSLLRKGFW